MEKKPKADISTKTETEPVIVDSKKNFCVTYQEPKIEIVLQEITIKPTVVVKASQLVHVGDKLPSTKD